MPDRPHDESSARPSEDSLHKHDNVGDDEVQFTSGDASSLVEDYASPGDSDYSEIDTDTGEIFEYTVPPSEPGRPYLGDGGDSEQQWDEFDGEITLEALMQISVDPEPFMLENYLPKIGIAVLIARPDLGKSMLCRNLSLAINRRDKQFLDIPLWTDSGGVIYVSTEDGRYDTRRVFDRMLAGEGALANTTRGKLRFLFTESIDPKQVLGRLERMLREAPADLVVLDGFRDLFTMRDANNNTEVSSFLRPFYELAQRYKCLLLFNHHINKSGYDDKPSLRHMQGASALGQKVRLVLQLLADRDDPTMRHLLILKGNGVSSEMKQYTIGIKLDETTLTFSRSGETRSLDSFDPGRRTEQEKESELQPPGPKYNLNRLFRSIDEVLRHGELVKRCMAKYGLSQSHSRRLIEKLSKRDDGRYALPANVLSLEPTLAAILASMNADGIIPVEYAATVRRLHVQKLGMDIPEQKYRVRGEDGSDHGWLEDWEAGSAAEVVAPTKQGDANPVESSKIGTEATKRSPEGLLASSVVEMLTTTKPDSDVDVTASGEGFIAVVEPK
ncbi:MAG: AAA family ATPase [Bacteroidetes bacterium]|nr:AAA family ATPase [Bacteroidota bacterium]